MEWIGPQFYTDEQEKKPNVSQFKRFLYEDELLVDDGRQIRSWRKEVRTSVRHVTDEYRVRQLKTH